MDFSDNNILQNELEQGNHEALVYLMNTYHHPLCLYVFSLSNDYELAKDIVQNVFIKIWQKRKKIQTIKSIKSFLYRSAYNGTIDEWRKDKKMLPIEQKHLQALDEIVEDKNEDLLKDLIQIVRQEIQKLPPRCKETFLLSKQDGLTNLEIAGIMNVSVRTVESQMNKGFKILREKLKDKVNPILFLVFDLKFQKK